VSRIQRNRGCQIRKAAGLKIVMYYDTPGVYYDGIGNVVSDELAAQAGYDVEKLAIERKKQIKRQKFEDDLAMSDDETAVEVYTALHKTLTIAKGTQPRTFQLLDARGKSAVVNTALSKREAEITYRAMTGNDYEWPETATKPAKRTAPAPEPKHKTVTAAKKKKKKSGAKGLL
jgi:hypothetical protein